MKQIICIVAILLMLASCATHKVVTQNSVSNDSTYISASRLDSLYRVLTNNDSIYRRDSIYVYAKGDTLTKYVERITYRERVRTDTAYRYRLRVDTMYIERVDSVAIVKPVYIDKPCKWYDKGFLWIGRLCCIAAIFWALFLYLKRKF